MMAMLGPWVVVSRVISVSTRFLAMVEGGAGGVGVLEEKMGGR